MSGEKVPQLDSTPTPSVEAPQEGQVPAVETPKTPEEVAKAEAKAALDKKKAKADAKVKGSGAEARSGLRSEVLDGFVTEAAEELGNVGGYMVDVFKDWQRRDTESGANSAKAKTGEDGSAVAKGKKPKELPSSWPEKLPVGELEYHDAPISTAKGFPLHLSSPFGDRGRHPVTGEEGKFHGGLDLNYGSGEADKHLPLYAGVSLQVKSIGHSDGGGNSISLFDPEHPEIVYTCLHLDERPPFEEGDLLEPGTCFAKIGDTGTLKTASHLHLEVAVNEKKVDPMTVLGEDLHLA